MIQTTNAGTATAMPDKRLVVDLVVDDPAEWHGVVSRAELEELSERLKTAFNVLRDRDSCNST